ncbi:MAG: SUMF1/EgtB/PvdO family nonheme iron enzyme [Candidatus Kariarchaeaceae archaeon]|jgi:formylglycine-generating enzyme required for sulfatase activity
MNSKQFSLLLIISLLIFSLLSCNNPNEPDDNTPPSVKIISPPNNSVVSGIVTIICVATDNQGIEKLELWINGNSTGIIDNSEPFELNWDTQNYVNGSYIITVRAFDINDNKTDSDPINLNLVNPTPMSMILVVGGIFTMGDTWGDGDGDELPIHSVTLDSFYIGQYEITQAQWDSIMGSNPSTFQGQNRPVERITWFEALTFCNSLSLRDNLTPCYNINGNNVIWDISANGYRLPTEAEWEFAARGGTLSQNYKFSGNNTPDNVAWYSSNSGNGTHEVGFKQPNELGIYDMSGNVWEFCWDWYGNYSASPQTNPTGPSNGTDKVVRGGAFYESSHRIRVSERGTELPNSTGGNDYIGLRLVRSL